MRYKPYLREETRKNEQYIYVCVTLVGHYSRVEPMGNPIAPEDPAGKVMSVYIV